MELGSRAVPILVGLLVVIAALGVGDLALDAPRTWRTLHVVVELGFIALCLTSALVLGLGWLRSVRSVAALRDALDTHRQERDAWRARAHALLRGLGDAIDAQFLGWGLTRAERETALLLLKGFSHKEIAAMCQRSERTVRQHAVVVYRKSGLSGRAELAAFFFEDMLLPGSADPPPPA